MKYLFILLFSITSNLALASYHGGSENPSSGDDGGGGYGGSSSAAGAIVAVGLIAYFVMNSGDDSEEADFISETLSQRNKETAKDQYTINLNNRKILNGVMEEIGILNNCLLYTSDAADE